MRKTSLLLAYLIFVSDGQHVQDYSVGQSLTSRLAENQKLPKVLAEVTGSSSGANITRAPNLLRPLAALLAAFNPASAPYLHVWMANIATPRRFEAAQIRALVSDDAVSEAVDSPFYTDNLPFYTDPELSRDRVRVLQAGSVAEVLAAQSSRFVLSQSGKIFGLPPSDTEEDVDAVFLKTDELQPAWVEAATMPEGNGEVVWIGMKDDIDFFVLDVPEGIDVKLPAALEARGVMAQPVRQFGDKLRSRGEAAVLATANGMMSFHRSHKFCPKCGDPTRSAKFGACRRCPNAECRISVYPRIDPSAIMLVLSPQEVDGGAHALLGRKKSWPPGRYSTLAGFAEVGESMEDCLVREVLEESGVAVDRGSVSFIASQPWPFPRSLMFGFRAHAAAPEGANPVSTLPAIDDSIEELEDVQWFSREYVRERLQGGSTALDYKPTEAEAEFHIPGKSSLARKLISEWAAE